MADPSPDADDRIFVDPDEVVAAAQAAQAVAQNLLVAHRGAPANDSEVRDLAYDAAEALLYVLGQLRTPSTLEGLILRDLGQLADEFAAARARELGDGAEAA